MPASAEIRLTLSALLMIAVLTACSHVGTPQNAPPVADAGPDQTLVVGQNAVLDGSESSDPEGDALAYAWTVTDRPPGSIAELTGASSDVAGLTPDVEGTYRVSLSVTDGNDADNDDVVLTVHPAGVERLEGDRSSSAADATFDLHVPLVLTEDAVELDPETGSRVLRTEIDIEFMEDATVGQVNDVLEDLGGRIVSMVRNAPIVVVEIPDPGDLVTLQSLIEELERRPAVASVAESPLLERPRVEESEDESDAGIGTEDVPPGLNTLASIDHHQAVRGHAAWNMRSALPGIGTRPRLLIGDLFGDGEPNDGYDIQSTAGDFGTTRPARHGYHVLGIIAGDYGPGASTAQRSDVAGAFPGTLRVRAVDVNNGFDTPSRTRNGLVQLMNDVLDADRNANIVVNTSIAYADPPSVSASTRNSDARKYINQLRNNGLEDRVVHVTSAGNADGTPAMPVRWNASINSIYAFAALGAVTGTFGGDIDNLRNVLVVENRVNTTASPMQRPVPGCASGGSIMGGQVSAIGTQVRSFGRPTSFNADGSVATTDSLGTSSIGGTSMAAPQVAGLAAFMWSLDPSRDGPDLVNLILATARNDYNAAAIGNATGWGCNVAAPSPVIDAFDAVLAAGGTAARVALLDVANGSGTAGTNGAFDERDISLLLSTWSTTSTLDYSRFDLNGDGVTHGIQTSTLTERVDLDGDGAFGPIVAEYLGEDVPLDERAVTDLDVLCYMAYSSPYTGSSFQRNQQLGQPCGIVDVDIVGPNDGDVFAEGEVVGLQVDVEVGGTHEGDVVVYSRGREQDRLFGYSYLDDYTIGTLSTREVCPGDPTVEVTFEDDVTGLRASDTVTLDIVPNALSVSIGGPNPRWVRVKRDAPGGDPLIDDVDLAGKTSVPTCEDPFSERIDQAGMNWAEVPSGLSLGTGPDLTLSGSYLSDGSGGFVSRDLELRTRYEGVFAKDTLTLRPCSSTLGLGTGESAVDGYAECPLEAVIGSVLESLADVFGTVDLNDAEVIVGRAIHGIPDYRVVLEELGSDPCDPTFCDPYPPTFPWSEAELRDGFYGDRGLITTDLLDRLFKVLDPPTLDDFEPQMTILLQSLYAETDISRADRELVAAAASVALAAADGFSPAPQGGLELWRNLGFAGDPATLVDRVDVLAPARRSVEGFLTAVVVENERSSFTNELYLDAAAYAAALAALEQAQLAPVE